MSFSPALIKSVHRYSCSLPDLAWLVPVSTTPILLLWRNVQKIIRRRYEAPASYLQAWCFWSSWVSRDTLSGAVKRSYYDRGNAKIFSDNTVQPGTSIIWIQAELTGRSPAWRSSYAETNNISGGHLMKHFLPQPCVIAERAFSVTLSKNPALFPRFVNIRHHQATPALFLLRMWCVELPTTVWWLCSHAK